jgi:hypothetical protein
MCAGTIAGTTGVAGAATAPASRVVIQPGGRIFRVPGNSGLPTISLNWSGYAAQSKTPFSYVHSTFVEPTIKCTGLGDEYTSNWSGLDGFTTDTVEQDGTFAWCGGSSHTTPHYVAWYEMFPAPSILVFRVHPGDTISSTVRYTHGKFVLTIADLTTKKSFTKKATCSVCKRGSAEWIVERPATGSDSHFALTRLADFGTTTMSRDWAAVDGGKVRGVGSFRNVPIFMVCPLKRGFISLDEVSALSGASFTAVWDRHGTPTPISLGPKS